MNLDITYILYSYCTQSHTFKVQVLNQRVNKQWYADIMLMRSITHYKFFQMRYVSCLWITWIILIMCHL